MNKREVLFLVSGLAIGIASGYFYAKKKFTSEEEEENYIVEGPTFENRDEEARYPDELPVDPDEERKTEILKRMAEANVENYHEIARDYISEETNYSKKSKKKSKKNPDEKNQKKYPKQSLDEEIEEELYPSDDDPDGRDPYDISYDEFVDDNPHFDKDTILYYSEDDTLIYESTGEQILNDEYVLGEDWRGLFGDDGTFYIRNERVGADYEVILRNESYYIDEE